MPSTMSQQLHPRPEQRPLVLNALHGYLPALCPLPDGLDVVRALVEEAWAAPRFKPEAAS